MGAKLFGILAALCLLVSAAPVSGQDVGWTVAPFYETATAITDTDLSFNDRDHQKVTLYSESVAVLIMQGAYTGSWSPAVEGAETSRRLLVKALEARRFHVLVWKDLGGDDLETVVKDVAANFSDAPNARLFFYYFGHGVARGDDDSNKKFFLVPVDAPPADDQAFVRDALSGRTLLSYFDSLDVKHAFFAFEACKSGGILGSLADVSGRDKAGYLTSDAAREPARQYLTAGNELQDIPADAAFSATLAGALSSKEADVNGDNYITATEATAFVVGNLPTFKLQGYQQIPEHRREPAGTNGDFIFGPYDPSNFDPYFADDDPNTGVAPTLADAFVAIAEEKYETAENAIRPFVEANDADGLFAMAALEAARSDQAKKLMPYVARAAVQGNTEAQRIVGVIRMAKEKDLYLEGPLISEESEGFYAGDLFEELDRLDKEIPGLSKIDINALADHGDPYALMALHLSAHAMEVADYNSEDDDDAGPPVELPSDWLKEAVSRDYGPAIVRSVLLKAGTDIEPWELGSTPPDVIDAESVEALAAAARSGFGEASYLLMAWRLNTHAALPRLTDNALIDIENKFLEKSDDPSVNPLVAADFYVVLTYPTPRDQHLARLAELLLTTQPARVDEAAVRLDELSSSYADQDISAEETYGGVFAMFYEARGEFRKAFDSYALSDGPTDMIIKALLRLAGQLGWQEDLYGPIEKAFDDVYCSNMDCAEISAALIALGNMRLAKSYAIALRGNADDDGQFSDDFEKGHAYEAYADITAYVLDHEGADTESGLTEDELRPFFEKAAKLGQESAARWLETRGLDAPLPEKRTYGPLREDWQFIKFQDRNHGLNCYVTSNGPLKLGDNSKTRKPNLIIYTYGDEPGVGLLQYNSKAAVDPDGKITASWDTDLEVAGKLSNSGSGQLVFTGHDPKVIKEMAKGKVVTIQFANQDGDWVADTYSLFGFTAAYRDMVAGCENMKSALD